MWRNIIFSRADVDHFFLILPCLAEFSATSQLDATKHKKLMYIRSVLVIPNAVEPK